MAPWSEDHDWPLIICCDARFDWAWAGRFNDLGAAMTHSSPENAEPLSDRLQRVIDSFDAQRQKYHNNASDPGFDEMQQEMWASLANEKANDLRVLRKLLMQSGIRAQQTTDPVAWLDIRTADLGWQNRIIATNPQYVENNGPENFVALYASSSPESRPLNDEELADLHMDAMETSRTMKDLLTSPKCGDGA